MSTNITATVVRQGQFSFVCYNSFMERIKVYIDGGNTYNGLFKDSTAKDGTVIPRKVSYRLPKNHRYDILILWE